MFKIGQSQKRLINIPERTVLKCNLLENNLTDFYEIMKGSKHDDAAEKSTRKECLLEQVQRHKKGTEAVK
jgi:hypothetical protein